MQTQKEKSKKIMDIEGNEVKNIIHKKYLCTQCIKYEGIIEYLKLENHLQAERIDELQRKLEKLSIKKPEEGKIIRLS